MTTKQARRILGKEARNISDDELRKEIQTATLLKDLFFEKITREYKTSQTSLKVP